MPSPRDTLPAAAHGLGLAWISRWVSGPKNLQPETILNDLPAPGPQCEAQLAEPRGEANKTAQAIG
jgi:hypothetical protein